MHLVPMRFAKTTIGFVINLLTFLASVIGTIGFFIWREDKPADNPGGPVGSLGSWVSLWNFFAISPGPTLIVGSGFCVLIYLGDRFVRRYGAPPPLEQDAIDSKSPRTVAVSLGIFAALLAVGVWIAARSVSVTTPAGHLGTGALILLCVLLIFLLIPEGRAEAVRWGRWIVRRTG